MAPRASRSKTVVLGETLPRVREALARDKALNGAGLARAGVPRAQHPELLALLDLEGFERTKTGVRVPLRTQIKAALEERQVLSFAELAKVIRASQKESKAIAAGLVSEGHARIVLRGKIEALAAASAPALSAEDLAALARSCRQLAALAAKAVKRGNRTLLRADVREQLLDFVLQGRPHEARAVVPDGAAVPKSLRDATVAELARHVRASVGLSFVPDAVRALSARGVPEIHAALIEAARAGLIELQPDSGLDRLSQEETALCPEGPQGTRLSWARLLGGAS